MSQLDVQKPTQPSHQQDAYATLKGAFSNFPYKKLILFGSRARGEASPQSDYDVLMIVEKTPSFKEKCLIAATIRNNLAYKMLDVDIIIKSEHEVEQYKGIPGNVVRNALREGVSL